MAQVEGDEDWDQDTDEINDIDSDELYETRPNRWKGQPSSWTTITEQDRLTYSALEQLRNQDLSIHLYNTFALKRAAPSRDDTAPVAGEDIDLQTGEPVKHHDWAPPQNWSAWPLRADLVPSDELIKRTEDEDDGLTYRRHEGKWPSSNLEEAISATVLKFAKENFRKRNAHEKHESLESSSDVETAVKGEDPFSENESPLRDRTSEIGSDEQLSDPAERKTPKRPKKESRSYSPIVSTNDDLSYELLRPSARLILEKLDRTLSILHNARVAAVRHDNETSASEDEEHVTRPRGRPRSSSRGIRGQSLSIAPTDDDRNASDGRRKNKKGAGRPRVNYQPREGETHREFLVRLAREQHKRIPKFSDEESETGAKSTDAERSGAKRTRERSRSRSGRQRTPLRDNDDFFKMEHISQWRLRDWSDVIGAAALAGFSPTVITHATERCVDLFGEGMELHTLNQVAAGGEADGVTTRFEPGQRETSGTSESDGSEGEDTDVTRARLMSRQSSIALSDSSSSAASEDKVKMEEGSDVPIKKPRARSRSRTPTAARFYCTHTGCRRAVQGFSRRNNLVRHMRLVHREIIQDQIDVEESAEEMDGAVHVDGFLKPIKPRPGWRADDTRKRSRSRKRSRDPREDAKLSEDD